MPSAGFRMRLFTAAAAMPLLALAAGAWAGPVVRSGAGASAGAAWWR